MVLVNIAPGRSIHRRDGQIGLTDRGKKHSPSPANKRKALYVNDSDVTRIKILAWQHNQRHERDRQ